MPGHRSAPASPSQLDHAAHVQLVLEQRPRRPGQLIAIFVARDLVELAPRGRFVAIERHAILGGPQGCQGADLAVDVAAVGDAEDDDTRNTRCDLQLPRADRQDGDVALGVLGEVAREVIGRLVDGELLGLDDLAVVFVGVLTGSDCDHARSPRFGLQSYDGLAGYMIFNVVFRPLSLRNTS